VALMAARPTEGVMGLFTSAGAGGHFARRAVLFFVILPFMLNWGEVFGELRGWYPQRVGWILESGVLVVGLLGLTWWVASALNRREGERQQLMNALSRSVERFELAARATQDATWDIDLKSGLAWWSDSYYERYGYGRDTIPSVAAWADHIHPDDRDRVTGKFNSALEGGPRRGPKNIAINAQMDHTRTFLIARTLHAIQGVRSRGCQGRCRT
jgi:PAS domain-containing protein